VRQRVTEAMGSLFSEVRRPLDQLVRLLDILATTANSQEYDSLSLTRGHRPETPRHVATAQRVLTYIHEHANRPLSQREVADLAGLSAAGFSRFFSRHFGKPFIAYLAEMRIGTACRLLMESQLSVAQIAVEVGFNNLANFNRRFRDLKGVTPTEYRRRAAQRLVS
jgi:transcriptional regulator GlxA family with amidase domain